MKIAIIITMGIGMFVGQLLYHGLIKKDWQAGFCIGLISCVIYVPLALIFMR